jgi:hypothetical protein
VEESALARAAFTDEGNHFAGGDAEVEVAENGEVVASGTIDSGKAFDADGGRGNGRFQAIV